MSVTNAVVSVMSTRLVDASGCGSIRTLVYSVLHLLEEVVDVEEVVLGPQIGQVGHG